MFFSAWLSACFNLSHLAATDLIMPVFKTQLEDLEKSTDMEFFLKKLIAKTSGKKIPKQNLKCYLVQGECIWGYYLKQIKQNTPPLPL